ncbi:helix-turn-helix domain-containing protein [Caldimonas thermodepolymerans]|uniref:helix-turn-helix domain-containing protein n=1 Tax=Caldimonas thermodepolymerans TaxID=215580 RepID=UPI002235B530|nr:helix-turn-helix domain-containing protein [Caldimonas thermodepolymerans]UZG44913.1 helix-turn-helix domain-containing protein [Caldimonas thermodepolymerans]
MSHRVPTYALYGEHQQPLMPEALHVESIADRSRLYNWEISPHRHDLFAQLLCLRSGHGEVLFADARVPFEAPCVITVPPLEEHGFRFSRDMDGLVITVVAHRLQGLLQAAPELVERLSVPHCLRFSPGSAEFAEIDRACTLLAREMRGAAPWRMNLVEASLVTALVLAARAAAAPARTTQGPSPRSLQHAQRFRALLDQRFREQRSIDDYARELGITPTQLNRVCREVLGTSALGALHARLMLEAKRDLAYTRLSVKEVALTLGFSDAAYFTRFFTRHAGMSPSEFRDAVRRELGQEG